LFTGFSAFLVLPFSYSVRLSTSPVAVRLQ
jgi:hypothetical protein